MSRRLVAIVTALSILASPALAQQTMWGAPAPSRYHPGAESQRYIPHDPKDDEWSTTTKVIVGGLIAVMTYGILAGGSSSKPSSGGNSSAALAEEMRHRDQGSGGHHVDDAPAAPSYGFYGTDHCLGPCD